MKRITATFIAATLAVSAIARADDLAGKYTGRNLSLELSAANGDAYSGTIHLGSQSFPLTAHSTGASLKGVFTTGGHDFPFTANLAGQTLTLESGGATYTLDREAAAVNPLANAQPENPLQAASATPPAPAAPAVDFTVLATTHSGKTLFVQQKDAKTAQTAIESTLPSLAKLLGARPKIVGAFADTRQPARGGATFSATKDGKEVRGTILAGPADAGESVTVVYAAANAPGTELATLNAALPTPVKMQTFSFPDGSGSVDLPDGWKTENQTVLGGVTVKGPGDQTITLGRGLEVVTPDSTAVQMQRQMEANARQWGGPPPPPLMLFVAPYTGPEDALKNLVPQISRFSQMNGGPALALDKIVQSQPAPANVPGGKAALLQYLITRGEGQSAVQFRGIGQIETYSLGNGAWGVFMSELGAPDGTFDHDAPTMWAIATSFKTNDAVVQQLTQQSIQQSNQRFAAFEQTMKDKNDAFDGYMQSIRNQQTVNSRTNADFDEVIRGYRTVEDTSTGDRSSVDLGKVDDVVNKLNEADPGRYKQIPLKDDMYPLPGN